MINRLKSLLSSGPTTREQLAAFDNRQLALAVLLGEAAYIDGTFDDIENLKIADLAKKSFDLNETEIADLIEVAATKQREAVDLVRFTRVIKDTFAPGERVQVIEMLWEVVYADGRVDDFEANLMRRLGGLLYVSDHDRGVAQKRVAARLATDGADN